MNHKEGFQRITNSYQPIIVDDANVADFTDTQLLALLDNSTSKSIRVMYKTVRKKKGNKITKIKKKDGFLLCA